MTTFADILGGPRTLVVRGLTFAYRPDSVTPATLATILRAADGDDPLLALVAYQEVIPTYIDSWDLTNEDAPVPLTSEGISVVPLTILDMVFEAIMEDREKRRSEEGKDLLESSTAPPPASTTPTSTETRRNGSATSPLPASIVLESGSS